MCLFQADLLVSSQFFSVRECFLSDRRPAEGAVAKTMITREAQAV